jgi:hypothetical protein
MDTKAIGEILGPRFDAVSEDGARALKELLRIFHLPPQIELVLVHHDARMFESRRSRFRLVAFVK